MHSCIGIDIAPGAIRLVQLSQRFGKSFLLGTHTHALAPQGAAGSAGDLGSALEEAIRESGFRVKAPVVLGLPHNQVFFCSYRTELAKHDDVRRLLKFELEDDVPVPFEDLITDICGHRSVGDLGHEYLIAAVSRGSVQTCTRAVSRAGRKCAAISTDVCALHNVARLCSPGSGGGTLMTLHVDDSRMILAVVLDGNIVSARHLPSEGSADALKATLVREIELTLHTVFGKRGPLPLTIHVSGPSELVRGLSQKLPLAAGHEMHCVDFSSLVQGPADHQLGPEYAVALGLALAGLGLGGEEVDFLNADASQVDQTVKSRTKRTAFISAGLLIALLALWGLRMVKGLNVLEAEHAAVDAETRAVFTEAFPDETKIVNEFAQMTERLDLLRKEHEMLTAVAGNRIRPLRILNILSERLTSDKGMTLSSLTVAEQTVRLTGTGPSFESVEQLLDELRQVTDFRSVELEDVVLSTGSDRPEFKLLLTVRAG